ncbi:hypothetical protein [Veillonella criceti]|uniref:Uncharacterized protein n=1 Tax=Veillonella criceti TaxID=103891 RepID=A0A380NLE0_9FIRM|nr:hypothetical protein [Veillonella criceti]SUP42497.1 Uncharacterised protein [Veillonella criceti]
MKRWGLRVGAAICMAATTTSITHAAPIEAVTVHLEGARQPLPAVLAKRMTAAVQTAADKLYIGVDTDTVLAGEATYHKVTSDIIDRILYGYTVESLEIIPGQTSQLAVRLRPYGQTIQSVDVTVEYGNLSSVAQQLVAQDVAFVEPRIEQILLGAPLDSLDWASAVTSQLVRNELEGALPEFIPQVEITPGTSTKVRVYLIPQGAVVRHSSTEISSNTLPSSIFFTTKRYYDNYLVGYEGVPVAFIARHEGDILGRVQEELNTSRASERFGISMVPSLQLGTDLLLKIQVDSSRYIVRGEAYLDMGTDTEHNVGFKLFTGVKQGRGDWYLETNFFPDSYKWAFYPSYAYHITPDTTIAYQYNLSDKYSRAWIRQTVGERWHMRAQRDFEVHRNEFGLGYDLNNYLTLEYVVTEDNKWLRLIGYI